MSPPFRGDNRFSLKRNNNPLTQQMYKNASFNIFTPTAPGKIAQILLPLLCCIWALFFNGGSCFAPASPINCRESNSFCCVSNAYGIWGDRIPCNVSMAFFPSTEDEILRAVAYAVKNKLKVRVVSGFSHSIPKLVCPGSGDGSGFLISTENYNKEIVVDKASMTVTADSGVGLRDVIEAAAAHGVALTAAPYWEGVSLGGLISTGSHGSSLWGHGGALHEYVLSVSLVVPALPEEGYAKVITLKQGDPDLNAAKVSLGVLGVITKVTVSVEPQLKRSVTNEVKADNDVEDEILPFAAAHEFGDLTWYPYQQRVVYKKDDRASVAADGDGVNDFIGFRSTPILITAALRSTEKSLEKAKNSAGKCREAILLVDSRLALANGLKNNDFLFTNYPVVGFQNKMQTSGSCYKSPSFDLVNACPWDPRFNGLFFYETTAIFSLSKIKPFISDVKKLRDMNPQSLCGIELYNGFLMRFIRGSTAYLGQQEDSVVIDFNYFRADSASTPRLNEDIWEEIEQMAFFKHGARPHWAKNRRIAFNGAADKYPQLGMFLQAMRKYDPDGLFSSDWTDQILQEENGGENNDMDGCALEGLCVCREDRHCAPADGYFCRPGRVYVDARVCRFIYFNIK
ncbi:hypothetical protein SUGI_0596900 [Cryptomeria japonica]|uniref:L-gulonolactone oxidase 3 n=1 Tax=Cryptomeria japonica TaxID=3369 RepID=UPI002414CC6B|nr:L-gulonolactone oxidase 3 [Cryptomeria japonica]GLJ30176.1 hypothetical protein SUGI_0596900 [Cryptomeria japonica]